jgi:hypothetical protein
MCFTVCEAEMSEYLLLHTQKLHNLFSSPTVSFLKSGGCFNSACRSFEGRKKYIYNFYGVLHERGGKIALLSILGRSELFIRSDERTGSRCCEVTDTDI